MSKGIEQYLKQPIAILTDKQLYRKVYREFRGIQKEEMEMLKLLLPKVIESDSIPKEWRTKADKNLFRLMLFMIQINWEPTEAKEKKLFRELKIKILEELEIE